MPDDFGSGRASNKAPTTSLLKGLKNRSPSAQDGSTKMKGGGSVSKDATRSTTAPTPKSLGPRCA